LIVRGREFLPEESFGMRREEVRRKKRISVILRQSETHFGQ
jgi:hypothetical protein